MRVVKVAYITAFVIAGLGIIVAFTQQMILLPFASIPLVAGIGIMRRRVWSAYGYALFQFAQLLVIPIVLFRSGGATPALAETIGTAAVIIGLIALFLFAGRSLSAAGSERGRASPWIAVSAICTLPLIFVQAFVIPTGTMEDTLLVGDRILVQRLPKPSPARGDIVVFVDPVERRQVFVKRVIGAPGDHIRISDKTVYRNGKPLNEPYAVHKTDYVESLRDNFPGEPSFGVLPPGLEVLEKHVAHGEVIVPDGSYFVLGDNRDFSFDSRYWGFITVDDVIGRPLLIYDSEDQPDQAVLNGKLRWWHRVRWNRFLKLL